MRCLFRTGFLRQYSTMSLPGPATSSPFTRAVVSSMRKIYPESLADKSWDNTGLLLEAPFNPARRQKNSVLLTVDLTKAVADEAIKRRDSVIVAYHPIIFRGLKSITLSDPQQQSLLRLAQEGISVYCPHTAVDAVPGGMADWLCDLVTGAISPENSTAVTNLSSSSSNYSQPTYVQPPSSITASSATPHTRSTIHPSAGPVPEGFESAGMGRLVTFAKPQPLSSIIDLIARGTGNPAGFSVAIPQSASLDSIQIRTVGVCPGSGAGVLMKATSSGPPDLLFTGELSHHDALAAIERGSAVVALFHSNTERGYIRGVMRKKLEEALREEWATSSKEGISTLEEITKQGATGAADGLEAAWKDQEVRVDVSENDRDPYGIVIRRGLA
ncbi:putative NGG1 interacting factor Nif3 [Paecilomyces variotii]|uniref:Putative NGG1 interacting factor Nif3 n=1 Tax=Byssochlamys spectabilis TaxID=264951 RepID=A0A443HLR3_BYSSP|nr:putative NGG1 interacting factor Nif3 [Paecilomyces variotii]RWQ92751.1 putative NGG1 interacting factor Nif3 [Paecilomyces variotii]